ncbi:MAG: glycoside hydrolase family 16 protein [Urechidicola sp.]|nr:glycoside hydrolase family 16 protein [Urechidicola sp.]
MKNIKYLFQALFVISALILTACEEEKYEFGDINAPSNLLVSAEIVGADIDNPFGDGSGTVHFTATSDNVITYKYVYDGNEVIAPSGTTTINFSNTGIHTYAVTAIAVGTGGVTSSSTIEVEVWADYSPPADLLDMLTGGSERTWRIKAEGAGHFGVGPADGFEPIWWSAAPFDKVGVGCYDDTFIFNIDGTFTHVTNGLTFGKLEYMATDLDGDQGRTPDSNGEVDNYSWDDYSENWVITAPGGQETLTFSNVGYHGFYVGGDHSYMILERSDDEMSIRTIGEGGEAWYGILTAAPAPPSDELDVIYTNLVWADEFDTDGAPDAANWTYDQGAGGWGNGESQFYTDRSDNSKVENGSLIITAKAESFGGEEYTSARLKSQGLQEFQYGRIDIYAKLPEGGGTWPALWMLGANFDSVGWPACGEIDIMEHVGNNQNHVQAAMHTPSSFGATVNLGSTNVPTASSEFHLYSMNWSADQISFLVDDEIFYTYNPAVKDLSTWPYDAPQFLILNIAMGGSLGGAIDPAFVESSMEIDYVRLYQ